jgi:hypothetical protein
MRLASELRIVPREAAMPLLDHFRAPQFPWRAWESFYVVWTVSIADVLNRLLPRRYVAEVQPRPGRRVEEDLEEREPQTDAGDEPDSSPPWMPPIAPGVVPVVFPDDYEVQVFDHRDDARLVAVVELVSPRNKDCSQSRRGFAAKSAAYLQRGVGLVVVDIVTSVPANLHNEMIQVLSLGDEFLMPTDGSLYAVAYRPTRRQERNEVDVWTASLAVGRTLPVLPLALRDGQALPLDLEATYTDARQRSRL